MRPPSFPSFETCGKPITSWAQSKPNSSVDKSRRLSARRRVVLLPYVVVIFTTNECLNVPESILEIVMRTTVYYRHLLLWTNLILAYFCLLFLYLSGIMQWIILAMCLLAIWESMPLTVSAAKLAGIYWNSSNPM